MDRTGSSFSEVKKVVRFHLFRLDLLFIGPGIYYWTKEGPSLLLSTNQMEGISGLYSRMLFNFLQIHSDRDGR